MTGAVQKSFFACIIYILDRQIIHDFLKGQKDLGDTFVLRSLYTLNEDTCMFNL